MVNAKTACQQACTGDAIVFGNVHDDQSQVSKIRRDNPLRSFYVLEQLHVLPNITYLAKVRNSDEIMKQKDIILLQKDMKGRFLR